MFVKKMLVWVVRENVSIFIIHVCVLLSTFVWLSFVEREDVAISIVPL